MDNRFLLVPQGMIGETRTEDAPPALGQGLGLDPDPRTEMVALAETMTTGGVDAHPQTAESLPVTDIDHAPAVFQDQGQGHVTGTEGRALIPETGGSQVRAVDIDDHAPVPHPAIAITLHLVTAIVINPLNVLLPLHKVAIAHRLVITIAGQDHGPDPGADHQKITRALHPFCLQ